MFSTGLSCTYARRSRNFVSHCCVTSSLAAGLKLKNVQDFLLCACEKVRKRNRKIVKTKNQLQTSHRFRLLCCLSVDISLSRCAFFVLAESTKKDLSSSCECFLFIFFFLQLLNDYWQIFFCFPFVLRSQTREWKLRRTKARQISIIFHTHQHSSAEHCRFQDVRNMKKILGKVLILQELINQTTRCASSARGEVKSLL